jgi:tetratricopeptide (TPR) repeat protein
MKTNSRLLATFFVRRVSVLLVAIYALSITASEATFVQRILVNVPVERLLTNLSLAEKQCSDDKCKADIEYRMARLHAMCYARRQTTVTIDRKDDPDKALDPVRNGWEENEWPDDRQFEVSKEALDASAKQALIQAIEHYQLSLKFEPNDVKTLLGLGWCLSEQKEYAEAKTMLRKAISVGKKIESSTPNKVVFFGGYSYESRRIQEAALYLIPLLDSQKDAAEITALSSLGKPDYGLHFETPIVVPISAEIPANQLMRKCAITFDIDGFGKQNLNAWPSKDAGWLVWDPHEKGDIRSGAELIGSNTFQIIWKNGYEVLSALDDNHNGKVEGKELAALSLWVDKNSNGKSEPGEVLPLKYFKISALSCRFTQRGNVMANPHGVRFASGKVASTRDWIYNIKHNQVTKLAHMTTSSLRNAE